MKYIGLDCHKQYDHATMIDTETGEIKVKRLAHIKEDFNDFIGDRTGTRMVIESCRDWSRTYELSEDLVGEIILAHPLKVKAIASAKIKTDAIDSRTLAQLLMADLIPQAHLRKGDNRVEQQVIRHRAFMMVMRTRVKSRIHDLVDSQLLPPDVLKAKPINLFSKKGMKWLTSLEWANEEDKKIVESHLRVMEAINHEISITNDMVKQLYEKDRDAQLLATIPGIGVTLAMLISTEIDGIGRFSSVSKLCSYAGLVPSTHSSGGKTYHGKITSEGNRWLRWVLVEAAVPASYADAEIKERLDIFRKKKSANVAKTAIARWLIKVVYHVLKERRPYITAYKSAKVGAAF
ncbi:MAG: IS110 family transposase [Dehalococcoidia bacterium]